MRWQPVRRWHAHAWSSQGVSGSEWEEVGDRAEEARRPRQGRSTLVANYSVDQPRAIGPAADRRVRLSPCWLWPQSCDYPRRCSAGPYEGRTCGWWPSEEASLRPFTAYGGYCSVLSVVSGTRTGAGSPRSRRTRTGAGRSPRAPVEASRLPLSPTKSSIVDSTVDQALEYLAAHQNTDGSFQTSPMARPAVTGLCVMAFLSRGHRPGEGEYGGHIEKAVDYILGFQDAETGAITPGLTVRVVLLDPCGELIRTPSAARCWPTSYPLHGPERFNTNAGEAETPAAAARQPPSRPGRKGSAEGLVIHAQPAVADQSQCRASKGAGGTLKPICGMIPISR